MTVNNWLPWCERNKRTERKRHTVSSTSLANQNEKGLNWFIIIRLLRILFLKSILSFLSVMRAKYLIAATPGVNPARGATPGRTRTRTGPCAKTPTVGWTHWRGSTTRVCTLLWRRFSIKNASVTVHAKKKTVYAFAQACNDERPTL